jgi:hypothetical protein
MRIERRVRKETNVLGSVMVWDRVDGFSFLLVLSWLMVTVPLKYKEVWKYEEKKWTRRVM